MAEFFKTLFNPYHKHWLDQKKRSSMQDLLANFANTFFGQLMNEMTKPLMQDFLSILMAVVHSHRHNKKEESKLISGRIDFDIVRDTMYKYSKKAQEKFFQVPVLSYLFAWFSLNSQAQLFIEEKFGDKGPEYLERMRAELSELRNEAVTWLGKLVIHKSDQKSELLLKHLNYISSQ